MKNWRRKWQPTPVFLPGESQGQGSLVGCRLWGHTELDTTEATQQQQQQHVHSVSVIPWRAFWKRVFNGDHDQEKLVFPVLMYKYKTWTIRKAKCQRIDAFKLWCWRRLLRVPWTTRRSNQSILKEINSEYSLEGLMLKLKLQYFGYLIRRADSLEKTLMLGKIEGKRRGDDRG